MAFKEKLQDIRKKFKSLFASNDDTGDVGTNNSRAILQKQIMRAALVVISLILILWLLVEAVSDSGQALEDGGKQEYDFTQHSIDLPDKALDTELYWRNYFEEDMGKQKVVTAKMITELKESQEQLLRDVKTSLAEELKNMQQLTAQQKQQFEISTRELKSALDEQRLLAEAAMQKGSSVQIGELGFDGDIEFDEPKSAQDYIPEGTFFSGYLLGGIVVSTALNTPDENATPIIIRLQGRGNLDSANQLDIAKCRMTGSAYGDLSSERAVIRLEKMICQEDGVYITSDIAGIVYGDDGFNGIKGTVVSTSTKHLKNAAIGGLISGLSGAAKGQEGISFNSAGLASSKSQGMGDLLKGGVMSGASNVGDKLADYYLRQAEAMSPVLTIPAGVKINTQITRGFFVGERGVKRKLQNDRKKLNNRG